MLPVLPEAMRDFASTSLAVVAITLTFAIPIYDSELTGAALAMALGFVFAFLAPIVAISLALFGWDVVRHAFHVQFSAEAAPIGTWKVFISKNEAVVQEDSNSRGLMGGVSDEFALHNKLSHSFIYENLEALEQIQDWARTLELRR